MSKSKLLLKLTRSGLSCLFLMMCLTSCATRREPPTQFLKDCEVTYLGADESATSASLLRLAIARELDVARCNVDKAALRAWYSKPPR